MLGIFLWTRSKEGSKIFLKPVCTLPVLIVRKEQTVILPGAKYKGETIMEDSLKNAIEQMKNGEEKGFNEVYSATYNRVYFRARQIMKKEEDAQDLTQIVFTEAYKSIHTLQASEALYSWLDGIAYNQGMKIYRKRKEVLLTEETEGIFDALESNDISSMPELTADQRATADIIRGIIEELPELQKTAVVAYYFDGLKVEQIAELMACSAGTIKSRLNYARKYIRGRVEEKEKKEGYRLHVVALPVFWYAIKLMADKTTLTAQTAQEIYCGACRNVGLQATSISAKGAGEVTGGAESTEETSRAEAAKTAGRAAAGMTKSASFSTAIKAVIVAGIIGAAGLGTVGIIHAVKGNGTEIPENEEQIISEETSEDEVENEVALTSEEEADSEDGGLIEIEETDKNAEVIDEEIPAGEAAETEPKTIAEVENLDEYEKWETEEGSSGQTMYVKQTGSEKQYISDDFYLTLGEYEGYWTLDGQELHFQGKDLEILKLTDLDGNPIDRRIAFYYLNEEGMVFVDIPDTEDWDTYAFRDIPDYIYRKVS